MVPCRGESVDIRTAAWLPSMQGSVPSWHDGSLGFEEIRMMADLVSDFSGQ